MQNNKKQSSMDVQQQRQRGYVVKYTVMKT